MLLIAQVLLAASNFFFELAMKKTLIRPRLTKKFQEFFYFILLFAFWWGPKESKLMSTNLWQAYFSYPQLPNPAKLSLHGAEPHHPIAQFDANHTKKKDLCFLDYQCNFSQ